MFAIACGAGSAMGIALAVTTVAYLGHAVATISVLGPRAASDVPLAGWRARAPARRHHTSARPACAVRCPASHDRG